jgi:quinol monooxygenase YgiN
MSSIVTVVAKLIVHETALESVKTELLKMIEPTKMEEGCIEYRLHQDNDDPKVFIFFEMWENLACLEQHMATPHFSSYITAVEGMIAEKTVHKMTRIA